MSRELEEVYKAGYRKGYLDGFNRLIEFENTPVGEGKAGEWVNISAEEVGADTPDFREEIAKLWDNINLLESRVKRLERAFYGD